MISKCMEHIKYLPTDKIVSVLKFCRFIMQLSRRLGKQNTEIPERLQENKNRKCKGKDKKLMGVKIKTEYENTSFLLKHLVKKKHFFECK